MKETVKMSRAICQLEKMFNTINTEKFNGELPLPIITIQSKPGTWGSCSRGKIWKRKGEETYELNLAAESVSSKIEEILDTMIHEMIHLYCRTKNLKEVSRSGYYHNKLFKDLAEKHGLICEHMDKYGWNTVGDNNDYLTEYALNHDWNEILIFRDSYTPIQFSTGTEIISTVTGELSPVHSHNTSSTRKYQCPKCKNSCRATKNINIGCLDCGIRMEIVK